MKKAKILAAVAAAAVLSVSGGLLAGCTDGGHTHTYSDDWKNDANGHWHVATCDDLIEGDTDYKSGYAAHVWGDDNECDTCGYVKVTPPPVVTEVTIKLDANGGTLEGDAETKDVETKNGKIETLPTPTAPAGMEFVGWYTEDVGGTEVTTETPFTAAGTIYAHYVTVYTITLNVGDGTLEATTVKAKDGKVAELPTPEAPADKEFAGWYTEAEGGTEVTVETEFDEDTTIYARYASVYTITLNVGESGSLPQGVTGTLTTHGGKLESLPTPETQNALIFLGWYTTAEDTAEVTGELVTADKLFTGDELAVTLYARYRQEVTITLNVNGGTLPEGTELTYITTESTIAELPTPAAPTNSWFKGWYTAETGGVKVTENTNLATRTETDKDAHTITLYAIYVEEVTVTLSVGENGTLPEGAKTTYTTVNGKIQLEEGEKGLPVPTVSKEHWLFYGWVNGTKAVDLDTVFETNATLTAKIGQEDGFWSSDGETFIAALTKNEGNTSIDEYWFGSGKKVYLEKDTVLTIYLNGAKKTNFWLKGALTNGGANGKTASSVTILEDAKFEVYIKNYPDGGTTYEFIGSPAAFEVVNEVDENCTEITVTWGSSNSIKFYLLDQNGAPLTANEQGEIPGYYLYAYKDGSEIFGNWQNLYTTGNGLVKTVMNGSKSVTDEDLTFIFRWGAIKADGNGGSQTDNFGGMLPGSSYVVNLKTNKIQEYVAPATPETPEEAE